MNIAILECHDDSYKEIARLCNPSKKKYCSLRGYEFIEYKFAVPKPYTTTWGRGFGVREHLGRYDWILYLDTDIIVTDMEFSLDSLADERFNLILGRMPDFVTGVENHLSTSAVMFRNNPWTFQFIDNWLRQTQFVDKPYHAQKGLENLATLGRGGLFFEQSALHYVYDTDAEVRQRTKLVGGINDREVTFSKSSFLIHFARGGKETRIKSFLNKRLLL